jgi:hypothetical protein
MESKAWDRLGCLIESVGAKASRLCVAVGLASVFLVTLAPSPPAAAIDPRALAKYVDQ